MSIGNVAPPAVPGGQGGGGQQQRRSALGQMDYNAFLKLLTAQLQHQDPTKPMDGTEYVAQLATFANVEQNVRTNARLEEVMTAVRAEHASNLLGRGVVSADGQMSGTVSGYELRDTQVVLLLDNGGRLPLGPGVKVLA